MLWLFGSEEYCTTGSSEYVYVKLFT